MHTEVQFIDHELTSWGGVAILKKMIDQSGFMSYLERLPLPEQGSNRGYSPVQLFIQFMSAVWCGAERYAHLDITRLDCSLQRLYGWKKMPEHKAFERYFRKFDIPICHAIFGSLYRWFFNNLKFDNFTLDIDSSVITRYGDQEGSAKGYNRHKPGRKSQHPILAFVADIEMVANFWLRSGDAHTANNFKAFLEETLSFLQDKKIGLLRLDSGFYSKEIFDYLENRDTSIDYIVAVPIYVTVQRKIANLKTWLKIENDIEISEFDYQAEDWQQPRRMITVRQKVATRPKATGKQLRLFEDDIEINGYRYSCYITSLKLSPADVWRLYRQRANCENRIKELKYDYGLDKMNQTSFDGTEASLMLMTIAYNFLSLFKQLIVGGNVRNRLKTLRHKILAIPAIVEQSDNKTIVKMALHMNRRTWIDKLCRQIDSTYARDG
jgi:NADH:ubiquinone oxidoreductase subunit